MMDPVPLDQDIIDQFKGKTLAIVGYETDQVMRTASGDVSVPITHAYVSPPDTRTVGPPADYNL